MSQEARPYPWRTVLPMGFYWAALGIFQGYTVKFYQLQGIPSGSVQMMFLMASAPLMALSPSPSGAGWATGCGCATARWSSWRRWPCC